MTDEKREEEARRDAELKAERKLKPCPFCGEDVEYFKKEEGDCHIWLNHTIECLECDIQIEGFDSKKEAFDIWNRRATPPGAVRGFVDGSYLDEFRKGHIGILGVQARQVGQGLCLIEVRPLSEGE